MIKPVVFLDADVIFAGAAAPTEHSASHVILRLGEITLLQCVTSVQVVTEVERNMGTKLPAKLPELQLLLSRSLKVLPDPEPQVLSRFSRQADPKDLPILVAALQHGCPYLLTFNLRHYQPPHDVIRFLRPGDFLTVVRGLLTQLSSPGTPEKPQVGDSAAEN